MEIDINNLTNDYLNIPFFKKVVEKIIKKEGKSDYQVSIVFVEEEKIKEINKKYRKKDKATDVLSFNYSESENYFNDFNLGEVFICPSQIKGDEKEIVRILIHGVLHLLNYDHEKSEKDKKIMTEKESEYFSFFK